MKGISFFVEEEAVHVRVGKEPWGFGTCTWGDRPQGMNKVEHNPYVVYLGNENDR